MSSAAASAATAGVPDDVGFRVRPITNCPHAAAHATLREVATPLPPCTDCGVTDEVWICLTCGFPGCSRYHAGHGAAHADAAAHPIAMSTSDSSIWCYACDAYLDVFNIPALHGAFAAVYTARFGEPPVLPVLQLSGCGAGSG